MNKISSMLDAVADSLEKKGLIKKAYEIDKIADFVDSSSQIPGLAYGRSLADKYGWPKHEKCIKCNELAHHSIENVGPLCDRHTRELAEQPGYEWIKRQKII